MDNALLTFQFLSTRNECPVFPPPSSAMPGTIALLILPSPPPHLSQTSPPPVILNYAQVYASTLLETRHLLEPPLISTTSQLSDISSHVSSVPRASHFNTYLGSQPFELLVTRGFTRAIRIIYRSYSVQKDDRCSGLAVLLLLSVKDRFTVQQISPPNLHFNPPLYN